MAGPRCVSSHSTTYLLKQTNEREAIHGDKQQNERDWVLNEFKSGKSPIMVATDVASRGIGMIYATLHYPFFCPFPSLMSCDSVCDALLSARFCYFNAIIGSRPLVSSPARVAITILDIQCSVACYTLSVSLCTSWVQRRNGLFLNCSSCIPGLYRMAMNWHALNQGPHEICYNCRESCREHEVATASHDQ